MKKLLLITPLVVFSIDPEAFFCGDSVPVARPSRLEMPEELAGRVGALV